MFLLIRVVIDESIDGDNEANTDEQSEATDSEAAVPDEEDDSTDVTLEKPPKATPVR